MRHPSSDAKKELVWADEAGEGNDGHQLRRVARGMFCWQGSTLDLRFDTFSPLIRGKEYQINTENPSRSKPMGLPRSSVALAKHKHAAFVRRFNPEVRLLKIRARRAAARTRTTTSRPPRRLGRRRLSCSFTPMRAVNPPILRSPSRRGLNPQPRTERQRSPPGPGRMKLAPNVQRLPTSRAAAAEAERVRVRPQLRAHAAAPGLREGGPVRLAEAGR